MAKRMRNTSKKDPHKTVNAIDTADIAGVSTDLVYKVLRGDRKNDQVLSIYMILDEEKNKLLKAVKKLVPFDL